MLVLHELDRTVEKKDKNSLPDLSDLKNENFLTTITDNIFFLYRPTYYGLNDYHSQFKGKHIMEVICFEKEKKEINFFEINANFNQFISLDPDSTSIM
jgi:replicative DNA helicase